MKTPRLLWGLVVGRFRVLIKFDLYQIIRCYEMFGKAFREVLEILKRESILGRQEYPFILQGQS